MQLRARATLVVAVAALGAAIAAGACKGKAEVKASLSAAQDESNVQWSQEGQPVASAETDDTLPVGVVPTPLQKAGGAPIATLPGFKMLEGGSSRVFVEISEHVDITESTEPWRITYHLHGVLVPETVNRMFLPTAHFNTPVQRVQLVQVGGDADLVVELRLETQAKTNLKPSPFGTMLAIDFPKVPPGAVFRSPIEPAASASAAAAGKTAPPPSPAPARAPAPAPAETSGW